MENNRCAIRPLPFWSEAIEGMFVIQRLYSNCSIRLEKSMSVIFATSIAKVLRLDTGTWQWDR